jgi:hypothetical protein
MFFFFFFFFSFSFQQAQTERKLCKTSAASVRNGSQTQHASQRKFCFAQHHQSLNVWFGTFVPSPGPRAHRQSSLNSRIVLQRAWSAVRLPSPHFTFFFAFTANTTTTTSSSLLTLVAHPCCSSSLVILIGHPRCSNTPVTCHRHHDHDHRNCERRYRQVPPASPIPPI